MRSVSIITPVKKNDLKFAMELHTVLVNQLHRDFEWIIVIDENFHIPINDEKLQVKIVKNDYDHGVAGARNTGIKYASKEYLYFLDCDDIITEHTLLCLCETAQNGNCDVIIGSIHSMTKRPIISNSYNVLFNRLLKSRNTQPIEAKSKHLRLTSLNILFKRSFVLENYINFLTTLQLFSDIPFNFEAFEKANKISFDPDAIYLKRERNDPIHYPSLKQEYEELVIFEYPLAYQAAKEKVSKTNLISVLDRHVIKTYYYKHIRNILNKTNKNYKSQLKNWIGALRIVDDSSLRKQKLIAKLEIKMLHKKFIFLAGLIARTRINYNTIKKFNNNPQQLRISIYKNLLMKLPVKKKVILYESFLGRNYSDSPKYIFQYIKNTYPNEYKHVWIFEDDREDLSEMSVKVKRFGFKYFYYLARAKYFVNNMRQPKFF